MCFNEITLEPLLDAPRNFKEMLFQKNWRVADRPKRLRSLVEAKILRPSGGNNRPMVFVATDIVSTIS